LPLACLIAVATWATAGSVFDDFTADFAASKAVSKCIEIRAHLQRITDDVYRLNGKLADMVETGCSTQAQRDALIAWAKLYSKLVVAIENDPTISDAYNVAR